MSFHCVRRLLLQSIAITLDVFKPLWLPSQCKLGNPLVNEEFPIRFGVSAYSGRGFG